MNKTSWLKFLKGCKEAHHVREIFNGTYMLLDNNPIVQAMFFDRIDALLNERIDMHTRTSLENLREDIEEEIETGRMRNGDPLKTKEKVLQFKPDNHNKKLESALRIMDQMRSDMMRVQKIINDLIEEPEDDFTGDCA